MYPPDRKGYNLGIRTIIKFFNLYLNSLKNRREEVKDNQKK